MNKSNLSVAVLFAAYTLRAQTLSLSPTPAFLQDVAGQNQLSREWNFEQEIQAATQANPSDSSPFAYWHGIQIRPWFHYDGIRNTTLTGSVSYIYYFSVPGTNYYKHPEWRLSAFGTLKQSVSGGSLFRFELLNFRASNGMKQHLPRVRFRFGQNLSIGEGGAVLKKPYLGVYQEAIVQFPQLSYSHVAFLGARFFAGYGFGLGARTDVLLGFKAEAEVSSSGSTLTLFYGPALSIEYNFGRRPVNEKHQRTTAFKDF